MTLKGGRLSYQFFIYQSYTKCLYNVLRLYANLVLYLSISYNVLLLAFYMQIAKGRNPIFFNSLSQFSSQRAILLYHILGAFINLPSIWSDCQFTSNVFNVIFLSINVIPTLYPSHSTLIFSSISTHQHIHLHVTVQNSPPQGIAGHIAVWQVFLSRV